MEVGETVPDFEATLQDGSRTTFSGLLTDGPVVLYFYPKAHTRGCTAESCHFRDRAAEFAEVGARRVGVSRDAPAAQRSFAEANDLDFPLISDPDGAVARVFGAKRPGPLWSRRQTFVVGPDRRLLGVVRSERDMQVHAERALQILRES